MRFLLLLFIIMPIAEMMVLFAVADEIGGLATVALVLLTAFIGINILKQQGVSTLTRANQRLAAGQVPATEILEGFCLAFGGALLLTPGFITDTVGFLLLIPPTRKALVAWLIKSGRFRVASAGNFQSFTYRQGSGYSNEQSRKDDSDIIEGEFSREQPENRRLQPDSDKD